MQGINTISNIAAEGVHASQSVLVAGTELDKARSTMILIHGRGATAENILSLAAELETPPDMAFLAPQASHSTWYPQRFIEPLARNEPYLSSALSVIDGLVKRINSAGIPTQRIVLLGFSQGACLALEYAARHAQRYGGVACLSGGLIGPMGVQFEYPGSMEQTPVFLGCSDVDFHIPKERVIESAEVMQTLGANVIAKLYTNMDHTINDDEIASVNEMLAGLV